MNKKENSYSIIKTYQQSVSDMDYQTSYFNILSYYKELFDTFIREEEEIIKNICGAANEKIKTDAQYSTWTDFTQTYKISSPVYSCRKIETEDTPPVYWIECKIIITIRESHNES